MPAWLAIYLPAFVPVYMPAIIPACLPACKRSCLSACRHSCLTAFPSACLQGRKSACRAEVCCQRNGNSSANIAPAELQAGASCLHALGTVPGSQLGHSRAAGWHMWPSGAWPEPWLSGGRVNLAGRAASLARQAGCKPGWRDGPWVI